MIYLIAAEVKRIILTDNIACRSDSLPNSLGRASCHLCVSCFRNLQHSSQQQNRQQFKLKYLKVSSIIGVSEHEVECANILGNI